MYVYVCVCVCGGVCTCVFVCHRLVLKWRDGHNQDIVDRRAREGHKESMKDRKAWIFRERGGVTIHTHI